MPKILVPPPYRGPTRGEPRIEVEARTVLGCFEEAEAQYPGFRAQVLDSQGNVHSFVRLFLNGTQVDPADLGNSLTDSDELEILAAISGG
jgi:hypothetical protein